jgi:hypothetical protein
VQVVNFIEDGFVLDECQHPIRLPLVDVLIPDGRLLNDTVFRENLAIESLLILVYNELRTPQILFQVIQIIICALVTTARH